MDKLLFSGMIINGIGRHVELGVPGKQFLQSAPDNWPHKLCPGSLNVRVLRYPEAFTRRGYKSVKSLDLGLFKAAFEIPQNEMSNNLLTPTAEWPDRGKAQVWRAHLSTENGDIRCWVLRRIGSRLQSDLELVSDLAIRRELSLSRDHEWAAKVIVQGTWADRPTH